MWRVSLGTRVGSPSVLSCSRCIILHYSTLSCVWEFWRAARGLRARAVVIYILGHPDLCFPEPQLFLLYKWHSHTIAWQLHYQNTVVEFHGVDRAGYICSYRHHMHLHVHHCQHLYSLLYIIHTLCVRPYIPKICVVLATVVYTVYIVLLRSNVTIIHGCKSLCLFLGYFFNICVLMRDEKEGRKKQARSNTQQGKATQHTRSTFPKKISCLGWDSKPRHSTL